MSWTSNGQYLSYSSNYKLKKRCVYHVLSLIRHLEMYWIIFFHFTDRRNGSSQSIVFRRPNTKSFFNADNTVFPIRKLIPQQMKCVLKQNVILAAFSAMSSSWEWMSLLTLQSIKKKIATFSFNCHFNYNIKATSLRLINSLPMYRHHRIHVYWKSRRA